MKKDILVSICCLTYNHENFIKDCLDGFLIQKTNFDYEVLIHDDASEDNTQEIIKSYQNSYPHIIKPILQNENQYSKGVKPTFIYNFPRAKGKYIALCEGDDYWTDPLKLQRQVDFLEENKAFVGVFHNTAYIDERQPNTVPKPWRVYQKDIYTAQDSIRKLSLFHTSSYCFRNLEYDYNLITNPNISSGDMMLLGLISKYGKLKLLDEVMSVYRKNEGGVTSSESQLKYHQNRIALNKALNAYFDKKFESHARKIINYHKEQLLKLKYPALNKVMKKLRLK